MCVIARCHFELFLGTFSMIKRSPSIFRFTPRKNTVLVNVLKGNRKFWVPIVAFHWYWTRGKGEKSWNGKIRLFDRKIHYKAIFMTVNKIISREREWKNITTKALITSNYKWQYQQNHRQPNANGKKSRKIPFNSIWRTNCSSEREKT